MVFAYSIDSPETFKNLPGWIMSTDRYIGASNLPLFLVGTKSDLAAQRQIEPDTAQDFANSRQFVAFMETSAKLGANIEAFFELVTRRLLKMKADGNFLTYTPGIHLVEEETKPPSKCDC